ncbi:MAG: PHP domain-containing protein [Chromatiaceae bacterium]|nr:PHP domain-containing protein [Chromatiaceae bacterium]MBP8284909.1 PHP domain-containing protein [Chromatiaceae bacterium]
MGSLHDLHTHSTASDGTLTPMELVVRAARVGIQVLALTDHDTLNGIAEAQAAAAELGLTLIPGVEISVTWGGRTIHILGLGLDPTAPALNAGLLGVREYRDWRAKEIGLRLAAKGVEGAYAGALALAADERFVGRTHFARFLVQRGYAATVRDVFNRYLVKGKPGFVTGDWASLEEALGWIREAGGQAVIAHPARYSLTGFKMRHLIGEFRELGGVGIEVVSGSHSRDEAFLYAQRARDASLLASAGSDYHGPEHPYMELGRLPNLPAGCTPIWADW